MRTLLVCRGPIAFEALETHRRCGWPLPHVVVSAKEWLAEPRRTAPWIHQLPAAHIHYVQSYTDMDAILSIAQTHHLDAVYPGYGFWAERAEFAERLQQAGLRFIGPTPAVLCLVGAKDTAIELAQHLGIATLPVDDAMIRYARTRRQADIERETIGRVVAMGQRYPGCAIRLKHPSGGGGKGQRVLTASVLEAADAPHVIRDTLTQLWAEMGVLTAAADADKGVLIELNLPRPLHWEVQLFGDGETIVHLAARDCSMQNQGYQKFIELALHPAAIEAELEKLEPQRNAVRIAHLRKRLATLQRICNDALRLGQAIGLCGAATVEFLIDEDGCPYFLEVNPRIQVEHAVTEGIARVRGQPIRLVEWQCRVAAGQRLGFQQSDITFVGDAIEARLNAWHEDLNPTLGGVVESFRFTGASPRRQQVRVEAGGLLQRQSPWIVPSYDANFALIIATGENRRETLATLRWALGAGLEITGNWELRTNRTTLIGLLSLMQVHPPETEFRTDTSRLWVSAVVRLVSQQASVLSLLPSFPRQPQPYDMAVFARVLRAVFEAGFACPSWLLTYYLDRLRQPSARPLLPVEVLWELADELGIPLFEEEANYRAVCQSAIEALWNALEKSPEQFMEFFRTSDSSHGSQTICETVRSRLCDDDPTLSPAEAQELIQCARRGVGAPIPAIRALIEHLERTQLHHLLTVREDLSLTLPGALADEPTAIQFQQWLSAALRPVALQGGVLCAPMEATVYLQVEPGLTPYVEVGMEIESGQTLALLESMKMFTELPSPVSGVLVEIVVQNGQSVKTGEPLFRIEVKVAELPLCDTLAFPVDNSTWQNRFGLIDLPTG